MYGDSLIKGGRYLLRGETPPIVDWAKEKGFERRLAEDTTLSVRTDDTPEWMVRPNEVETIRYPSRDISSRYFPVLGERTSYSISAKEPFQQVDFFVTNLSGAETVRVSCDPGSASTTPENEFVFVNDLSFECGDYHPISISLEDAVTDVEIAVRTEAKKPKGKYRAKVLNSIFDFEYSPMSGVRVGTPALRTTSDKTPILFISIDTLRFDQMEQLQSMIDALGDEATIPHEPRTKGHWTPPSHASMFTGVHPGEHGYVGWTDDQNNPIHPELVTLPEFLTENYYKCSALVSHTRILPEFGFGRGFYRFRLNNMKNWITRENDAQDDINRIVKWIGRDMNTGTEGVFYFLHLFDPHFPYIPPFPDSDIDKLDLRAMERYRNQIHRELDYVNLLRNGVDVERGSVNTARSFYEKSVEYTASQVTRLINHLKNEGYFDRFLIIITGDHGEEFGERGFFDHNSLYDANIRPFMIVKPPTDGDWEVPDRVSTLDIFPTIAREIGETAPSQCQGHAWQRPRQGGKSPRMTERIFPDWYNIAVEMDEKKAIFTYEENFPNRPTRSQLDDGPYCEEYYDIDDVRSGQYADFNSELSEDEKARFRTVAEEFISSTSIVGDVSERAFRPTQETNQQLEYLGYR